MNCANCPEPDLKEFKPWKHHGIFFDEASAELVLRQKKLFRGPPTPVSLGCSTTNCHSYEVWVSGVAMTIASNTWNSKLNSLEREEDRDWLSKNAIVVEVGTVPLWRQ